MKTDHRHVKPSHKNKETDCYQLLTFFLGTNASFSIINALQTNWTSFEFSLANNLTQLFARRCRDASYFKLHYERNDLLISKELGTYFTFDRSDLKSWQL